MTNVVRSVFEWLGHAIEPNLVDPREEYQAILLGDPVARRAHRGQYTVLSGGVVLGRDWESRHLDRNLNKAA